MSSEASVFLTEAYRIMKDAVPDPALPERNRMIELMLAWDGGKLGDGLTNQLVAQQALCYIGTEWHDDFPFAFTLVAERLREVMPALGRGIIDLFVMRDILRSGDKPILAPR